MNYGQLKNREYHRPEAKSRTAFAMPDVLFARYGESEFQHIESFRSVHGPANSIFQFS